MNASRTENASRNLVWGMLNKIIAIGMPFATRTVMIYTMGMLYVGLGSLLTSVLQVLSLAELGVGSAMVFSMYKPIAEGDEAKVCALLNVYRKTYRCIGIVIFCIGLILLPFLKHLVSGEVPSEINLQVLFLVYLLNNLLGYFLFAYKQSVFFASQRVDIISKIGMLFQIISCSAQILTLLFIHSYYAYVIVIPISTCLNNLCVGFLSKRLFPQYKCQGTITRAEAREIRKKIIGLLFQKIGTIVLSSVDIVVISAFLGLRVLGVYNGYYYVITAMIGFFAVLQQSMIPSIGNSIALESVEKNLQDFHKFLMLYMWIVIWVCSCLLCLFQPFIQLWQGADNMLSNEMVILFVIFFFAHCMGDVNWMYREALGYWWQARFVPLISSMVNLVLNIVLVKNIGLPGILISSIISLTFVNMPWSSRINFSLYFKSKMEYWRYLFRIGYYFIMMCATSFITGLICRFIPNKGILFLGIKGVICVFIPNMILFLINFKNPDFMPAFQTVFHSLPPKMKHLCLKKYNQGRK